MNMMGHMNQENVGTEHSFQSPVKMKKLVTPTTYNDITKLTQCGLMHYISGRELLTYQYKYALLFCIPTGKSRKQDYQHISLLIVILESYIAKAICKYSASCH